MIVEEVCHWFDLLRLFAGEIESVHCVASDAVHKDFDFEDIAHINCTMASGVPAHITHNLCGFDYTFDIWVIGAHGALRAWHKESNAGDLGVGDDRFQGFVAWRRHWDPKDYQEVAPPPGESVCWVGAMPPRRDDARYPVHKKCFGPEVSEWSSVIEGARLFAECVATGKPFPTTARDGVQSLAAALAARKSAREGRIVRLSEMNG